MEKILFICEGSKEKSFINQVLSKLYPEKFEKNVYKYRSNIYSLYNEMKKDNDIDIIELLKERCKDKNSEQYKMLNENKFSYIYLFFDFDIHEQPIDNYKVVGEMVNYFNDETEQGKLFVNYPMLESYKHFKKIPDDDFFNYKVTEEESKNYKQLINNFKGIKIDKLNEFDFSCMIYQIINKYSNIVNGKINNYESYCKYFSQEKLYKKQISLFQRHKWIYVLNTSMLWGIDYFGLKEFERIFNDVQVNYVIE